MTSLTERIFGSERSGPNWILCAGSVWIVTRPDIAGVAKSFIIRSTSALATFGCCGEVCRVMGLSLPVAARSRKALETSLTEASTFTPS